MSQCISFLSGFVDAQVKQPISQQVDLIGKRDFAARTAMTVAAVALVIIGALAVSGVLTGPALGWSVCGLGGASVVTHLMSSKWKHSDFGRSALASVTFVALGALGATGVLSGFQVGMGVLGTTIASLAWKQETLSKFFVLGSAHHERRQAQSKYQG